MLLVAPLPGREAGYGYLQQRRKVDQRSLVCEAGFWGTPFLGLGVCEGEGEIGWQMDGKEEKQ